MSFLSLKLNFSFSKTDQVQFIAPDKGDTIFDLITTQTPVSAQLSNFLVFRLHIVSFYLLLYKSICCWYSFELPQLVEAIQMSTNNICFHKENQKKIASTSLNTPSFSSQLIFLVSLSVLGK